MSSWLISAWLAVGGAWLYPPWVVATAKLRKSFVPSIALAAPALWAVPRAAMEVIAWTPTPFRLGQYDWFNTSTIFRAHHASLWPTAVPIRWSWPGRGTFPNPGTMIVDG